MIYENFKNSFRIYDNIAKQSRFLKAGEVSNLFGLICPYDGVLPWQMKVPGAGVVTEMKVRKLDDTVAYDLAASIAGLEKKGVVAGGKYILHHYANMGVNMTPGQYYMSLIVDGEYYYSEVFTVVNCISWDNIEESPYLMLKWNNDCGDLGPILYQTGWNDVLFLDTVIEREEPSVYEEGSEDAIKNFTAFLQKYVDNLNFDAYAPFHIVETLVLMSMHKTVTLWTIGGLYTGPIRNIKASVASVVENIYVCNVKFQQDTVYVNTGCCEVIPLIPPCVPVEIVGESALPNGSIGIPYESSKELTGDQPYVLNVVNKPDWMTIDIDGTSLNFYGTPDESADDLNVTLGITNECGEANMDTTIDVLDDCEAVVLGDDEAPAAVVDEPYSFSIPITGTAPYTLGATTLPSWMSASIDGTNLVLTGTPTEEAADDPISVVVENSCGDDTYESAVSTVSINIYADNGIFSGDGLITMSDFVVNGSTVILTPTTISNGEIAEGYRPGFSGIVSFNAVLAPGSNPFDNLTVVARLTKNASTIQEFSVLIDTGGTLVAFTTETFSASDMLGILLL